MISGAPATRPLPFAPGDVATLLCVGVELDVLYARVPAATAGADTAPLSPRDRAAVPRGRSLIVRTGISRDLPVPGEWFEVAVERAWRFGSTDYLKGTVGRWWLDLDALALEPLAIAHEGAWTLAAWLRTNGLEVEDLEPEYARVAANPVRREVEMEQVLPDPFTPLEYEEDGILEAVGWKESGEHAMCQKILSEMLRQDLRCIDAHAHLGNLFLDGFWGQANPARALRHYQIGVAIAERALAPDGRDLTPRGWIDNRPYLRALHGMGLAARELGDVARAERCFAKLLWRDPSDGAGARFLLHDVRAGRAIHPPGGAGAEP